MADEQPSPVQGWHSVRVRSETYERVAALRKEIIRGKALPPWAWIGPDMTWTIGMGDVLALAVEALARSMEPAPSPAPAPTEDNASDERLAALRAELAAEKNTPTKTKNKLKAKR